MSAADRLAEARLALVLLTRLPVGRIARAPALGATAWAWPLAGAAVGLGQGAVLAVALAADLPASVAALLAVTAGLVLTGGLHEDGLADLTDGLGGGDTPARRLEIMRDSRIGSHGAAALILALALRAAGFAALTGGAAVALPVAAAMLSRATLPALLVALPQARRDGLGAAARPGSSGRATAVGAAIALLAALLLLGPLGLAAALAAAAAATLTGALARRRLGGITGDVLGAAQVVAELAALVAWLALSG